MIAPVLAWAARLFGGFALWKSDKLGKVIYVCIIIVAALFVYTKIMEPKFKNISQQKIERVEKIEYHNETIVQGPKERAFIGVKIGPVKLGLGI
ncbi:MAG: hypothetical protein PHP10_03585 [Candidatus Omnitrophica bacterium]|nr:hypothetical protein [Candidatus Omnitrophota bacterium]